MVGECIMRVKSDLEFAEKTASLSICMNHSPKKKKTDYEALNSAFMRIPNMRIEIARDLIDLGFSETYQLAGRAPEILVEDLKEKRPSIADDRLPYFKMAVYYAEHAEPEAKWLHPAAWI